MKTTLFLALTAACLLIVLGRPSKIPSEVRQEEEYSEEEFHLGELSDEVRVTYRVLRDEWRPIADILWLKQAAREALRKGTPYFNVLEQEVNSHLDKSRRIKLTVIDGTIQLERDPMMAQYDAYEILRLILGDESL